MAFIAGAATIDSVSFFPGGPHPTHDAPSVTLCLYPAAPLAGTPYESPNVSIGPKDAAIPLQMYGETLGVPAPTPAGAPQIIPPPPCVPLPRTIEPVVNKKVKINGSLVAVSGDHSDTPNGQSRVLTEMTLYPKIQLCTRIG